MLTSRYGMAITRKCWNFREILVSKQVLSKYYSTLIPRIYYLHHLQSFGCAGYLCAPGEIFSTKMTVCIDVCLYNQRSNILCAKLYFLEQFILVFFFIFHFAATLYHSIFPSRQMNFQCRTFQVRTLFIYHSHHSAWICVLIFGFAKM